MDFRRQRYFLAVAQNLGFRRAAEVLNVSQPALSQQIQALEDELGLSLIDRTGRTIRLTRAGEEYCRGVETILGELQRSVQRARDAEHDAKRSLSIGTDPMMLLSHLSNSVKSFRSCHPGIRVMISMVPQRETIQRLLDRRLDVMLANADPKCTELHAEPVCSFQINVALPLDHPLAENEEIDLRALEGETVLVPAGPNPVMDYNGIREICRTFDIKPFDVFEVFEENPSLSIVGLVACGLGFAFVSSGYRDLLPSKVAYRRVKQARGEIKEWACFRRIDENAFVTDFVNFLKRPGGQGQGSRQTTSRRLPLHSLHD